MKNRYSLLLGLAILAIAGCTQDLEDVNMGTLPISHQIHIEGSINQEYVSRVNDGGFCTGDQIGLYGVNYTDNNTLAGELLDEGNQVDNARYTFDAENWVWTSSGNVYYKDSKTNIDLYGYYPYGTVNSVSEYAFEVQQDQSGNNSVDGYAQSDFLWGKATNIAPTEQKIKILFNHKMACANVVLVEGENFADGEFASLKKSVLVMNTSRTSTIDLATGVVSATGEVESEGIVMKSNEEGYKAIVVPQTVAAGASLFSITVDGVAYRFKKDVDFTYEQGKQVKFTIEVSKKVPSGDYEFSLVDCEIVDWIADIDTHGGEARQYYVVHQEEPGTLSAKLRAEKKDPTKIKNLKISGKIDATDFYFMRDSMSVLQAINLKETTVNASWRLRILPNGESSYRYCYFSGEMPVTNEERNAYAQSVYPGCGIMSSDYLAFSANAIPDDALKSKKTLTTFVFPEYITRICNGAFCECTMLAGALIIPNDVVSIGGIDVYSTAVYAGAFYNCTALSSVSFPPHIKEIGNHTFSGCSSLSGSLNLPASITKIGMRSFDSCSGLTGQLILPENLTELGTRAFGSCSGLTGGLQVPESLTFIEWATFQGCSGLDGQLVLHNGIKEIGANAFERCSFQGELTIPTSLTNISAYCFTSCHFSTIIFPEEGLLGIEEYAFSNCSRLLGEIELPKTLVLLGKRAFADCPTIENVVFPFDLGVIQTEAFYHCFGLNRIVCDSTEPPTIQSGTFDGVGKENVFVEVPEQSINRYQNDTKWGEFKNIGAHYDFSISRREMRVLNAEHSREFVLRAPANYTWSIESKPDWCTITPSSGVGKQNVVVTVSEMTDSDVATFEINTGAYNSPKYETHNGRAGEIVFLLNDKNYRTTLKVEQYDCDNYDGEVITNQPASVGNGVNIVFMGDCFDARDIANGSYLKGVNEAIGYYFDIEPYKTYKPYFNIYTVVGMSNDSGMGTVNTIRDAKFGSQYSLDGISPNHETTYEYAMKATTVNEDNLGQTLVVMIENTTEYGGICYMWGDGSAIACCPMSDDAYPYDFRGIVQHEAGGHGFGKLADEYIYTNGFVSACACSNKHIDDFNAYKALGWYRNLESVGDMDKVGWSHLIFNPKYSNIVDVYEGGFFHSRGIFRSEPNSCMNNNIPYYSAISRQEMVERIMKYADKQFDINEFYANDVLDSQGNITGATRLSVEENAITLTGAGKQMPPKFMGDKPKLKKSNK